MREQRSTLDFPPHPPRDQNSGHGFATEMARTSIAHARQSGFADVIAGVDEVNAASLHILEKLGFERVTTQHGTFGNRRCGLSSASLATLIPPCMARSHQTPARIRLWHPSLQWKPSTSAPAALSGSISRSVWYCAGLHIRLPAQSIARHNFIASLAVTHAVRTNRLPAHR